MKLTPAMTKMSFALIFIFLLHLQVTGQNNSIRFSPQWFPQAQFAGYYIALDKGFYKDAGLDISIVHPSSTTSAFDLLRKGQVDVISSFLIDGLKEKAKGLPIVHLGQLSQHSALMMVTKKSGGIDEIKKLNGKKLGIWSSGFDDIPKAFIKRNNYKIELVPILNTINLFLLDGVDALTVMYYNEYDQIINSGINEDELNTFYFADYGFDIPEDALFCNEQTYNQNKEKLKRFVQATLKGWEYAASNKEYAIDLVIKEMKKAHIASNKTHQAWMLDKVIESISPGNKNVKKGQLLEQDFHSALNVINASGIVFEEFCK